MQEKELSLKREISTKTELEEEIKTLGHELTKVKEELSVNKKMYDGLKEQYAELEESTERLIQQAQKESVPLPQKETEPPKEKPEIKEGQGPRIEISLQDLDIPEK